MEVSGAPRAIGRPWTHECGLEEPLWLEQRKGTVQLGANKTARPLHGA